MSDPLQLRSREQIAGDIIRKILIESDLSDVSPGSTLATLIEGIASVEFQIQMSILKILEASNIDSLVGASLDKKAASLGISNTVGGQGRIPAIQSSGMVAIGSGFVKVSSKPYAGKPAPFAGARTLYLDNASGFKPAGGEIYIGRGTVDRFEGPIPYTKVENTGSYWVLTLSKPLTKNHPYTDQIILSQGGDRTVPAGTIVQIPANTSGSAVAFITNFALLIPDGESEASVAVACVQSGESGNALAGSITEFASRPFASATVTNKTKFVNGRSTESDEELRKRIKNYPATLSRGTKEAVLAAIQGIQDSNTGRTIVSSNIVEAVRHSVAKVYIEDGTGLEPSFDSQSFELLINAASGQETKFQTAQVPLTPVIAIGSSKAPFQLIAGQSLTVAVDGIAETFYITPENYRSLNAATAFEVVRDFNSSSNFVGFRTTNGGSEIVAFDLSGQAETMQVYEGDIQANLGFPTSILRPIFLYKNGRILSFKGSTATLSSATYPWNLTQQDLDSLVVEVDGVVQTFKVTDRDFSTYDGAQISTASLSQWADLLSKKIAGVTFTPVGNTLVWSSNKIFSPSGSLAILPKRSDGSPAAWIGSGKMWHQTMVLEATGALKDFELNRFTGQIELLNKPEPAATIEIGSRNTRAFVKSEKANSGLFVVSPRSDTTGTSKLVVAFDGDFNVRGSYLSITLKVTPSFPNENYPHILRLTANHAGLFQEAMMGDYVLVNKSTPRFNSDVEGVYRCKSIGAGISPVDIPYSAAPATVVHFPNARLQSYPNSRLITVQKTDHGLDTGALVNVYSENQSRWSSASAQVVENAKVFVEDADTFYFYRSQESSSDWEDVADITTNKLIVSMALHGFQVGSEISINATGPCGGISTEALTIPRAKVNPINDNTFSTYSAAASTINSLEVDDYEGFVSFSYLADCWVELEVPTTKKQAWQSLTGTQFEIVQDMIQVFRSTSTPQLVDFGSNIDTATSDQVIAIFNDQTSGGSISKIDPQTLVLRSNNYVDGTCAVLATVGNAVNVFTNNTATSIQAHTASTYSTDVSSGFPVVTAVPEKTALYPTRTYLKVDKNLTDIHSFSTGTAAVSQSPVAPSAYPVGFQEKWLSGRLDSMTARIYNTSSALPFAGIMRTDDAIKPIGQSDSTQSFNSTNLDLYSNYSLRCSDLPFTDSDRLVVVMDSDGVNKTVSVPMYKKAKIQSIDALTGGIRGSIVNFRLKDPEDLDELTGDSRAFFDEKSIFKNFNLSDFVIQTRSVGVYADTIGSPVPAKGFLNIYRADPFEGIVDTDTITLKDGINPDTTFEYVAGNRTVTSDRVPVNFDNGEPASGSITAIDADPSTGIKDGDTFTVSDGRNPATTFEFDTDGSVALGNIRVALTPAVKAVGHITVPASGVAATSGLTKGDTFTLTLPDNTIQTYELVSSSTAIAGRIAVNYTSTAQDAGTIKNQIISAINLANANVSNGFYASAGSGYIINIESKVVGTASNKPIAQTIQNADVTFDPKAMSGGLNWPTASEVKTAIKAAALNATLFVTCSDVAGSPTKILITNKFDGAFGNTTISESVSNGKTLSPVKFKGGVDGDSVSEMQEKLVSAINTQWSRLKIKAASYGDSQVILWSTLSNQADYPAGNKAISSYSDNYLPFVASNMQGGTSKEVVEGKGLVVRSATFNAQTQTSLQIKYAKIPSQPLAVSHTNSIRGNRNITQIAVTLGSGPVVSGSVRATGYYDVEGYWIGNLALLRFKAPGLNTSQEYSPGNVLVVGGSSPIAGSYKITSASSGLVEVISPAFGDVFGDVFGTYDAAIYPLSSFTVVKPTFTEIADKINAYSPKNPIATAEAVGTGLDTYKVSNPSYISQEKTKSTASIFDEASAHHALFCKDSGRASVFSYDSSDKNLNNIKALVQSEDSLFPNLNDVGTIPYSPANEDVVIVPSNAYTLSRWLNFSAVSSVSSIADISLVQSNTKVQLSSRQDGSSGAVKVSGVTANNLDASVYGNAFSKGNASAVSLLWSEAKGLATNQMVKITNAQVSELYRPYRNLPNSSQETQANNANVNIFFRPETSVRYERLNDERARLTFLRYGMGSNQTEPLSPGSVITFHTSDKSGAVLPSGLIRVSATSGSLSARTGDMLYIRPDNSPFPEFMRCKSLPANVGADHPGLHDKAPEYWGYPVVSIEDNANIIIIAPNAAPMNGISTTLTRSTDLVFMPAIWNEKNIRTNRAEGSQFTNTVNDGQMSALCRKIGGGMVSIFVHNSQSEATDTMLLDEMSVSTDDWVMLGEGFSQSNRGTFRLVAHNGRNHLIVYNPQGVNEDIDLQNMDNRSWTSSPIYSPRPIRILDGESVKPGDRLRIGSAVSVTQPWFPVSMIGTWEVVDIGYVAKSSSGTNDPGLICPFVDISIPRPPVSIANTIGATFVLGSNVTALGFVEKEPFTAFRMYIGSDVNPLNSEQAEAFLVPSISNHKITEVFGTTLSALYKLGFSSQNKQGIDGYKVYTGLIAQAHRIIDGSPTNNVLYPGVRAAGTKIEVLPPLIKAIGMTLSVSPKDGVSLDAISPVVKSNVASYINSLGVGKPVVISEIIKVVKSLPGVFSVSVVASLPKVKSQTPDRIVVGDDEKAIVLDATSDIVVG